MNEKTVQKVYKEIQDRIKAGRLVIRYIGEDQGSYLYTTTIFTKIKP